MTTGYVYTRSEPGLWTVGHYHPDGTFEPESDHRRAQDAAERVAWLNGSPTQRSREQLRSLAREALAELERV